MGLHICVYNDQGREHPTWDSCRFAADRDFPKWSATLPRCFRIPQDVAEAEDHFRPVDFPRWRAAIPADCDYPERFHELFDLLEADAQWWLYFSF